MPRRTRNSENTDLSGDAGQEEVQATFDEAAEKGFFGQGTEGKDRDKFTVANAAGGTDVNDDSRAAANTSGGAATAPLIDPNAGAPGVPANTPYTKPENTGENE